MSDHKNFVADYMAKLSKLAYDGSERDEATLVELDNLWTDLFPCQREHIRALIADRQVKMTRALVKTKWVGGPP